MGATGSMHRGVSTSALEPAAILPGVVEMSDDAILTCDASGLVASWCATAERLFGRSGEDALDSPLEALFPEHLRPEVEAVVSTVLAGERIRHFESEIVRPDGLPWPVSLSLCPVHNDEDRPVGVVVVVRDVTEQRLAQASLAEVDARLEEGEALAHIGSWLWDLRTGAVQWSAEFHRIHGVDPLDFNGTFESYMELLHPDDRGPVRAAMVESANSGRPFNGEYRLDHPDRTSHVIQIKAQPTFGSAGTAVGLRGIGQNVTDPVTVSINLEQRDS
jgi:PAS domain S-box-containing protein